MVNSGSPNIGKAILYSNSQSMIDWAEDGLFKGCEKRIHGTIECSRLDSLQSVKHAVQPSGRGESPRRWEGKASP